MIFTGDKLRRSIFLPKSSFLVAWLCLLLLAACAYLPFERVDYKVYPTAENPDDFFGRVYAKTRIEEVKVRQVTTTGEASQLVGFPVRLPAYLPENLESITNLITSQLHAYLVNVDLKAARALLQSAGIPTTTLPTDLESFQVEVSVPPNALTHQGPDPHFVTFIQTRNLSFEAPPGVEPALLDELGILGWQYLGMTPEQAQQLSQRMNWASFLVLPPSDMDSAEGVMINGGQAVALQSTDPGIPHQAILWEDDGILYGLYSSLPLDELLEIAASLK
jgi:hypothetical protein